jgi:hypothetical protein
MSRHRAGVSLAIAALVATACTQFGTTEPTSTAMEGADGGSSPDTGSPDGGSPAGGWGDVAAPPVDGAGASAYASAVMADRPLAYWRLEETTGTTSADETGKHNCNWIGIPTLGVTGRPARGRAVQFAREIKLVCGPIAFLSRPAYTVEFWMKASPSPPRSLSWVFQNQQWFPKREGLSVYFGGDWSISTERYFDGASSMFGGSNRPSNVWVHVAVVYESGKQNIVYVNGSPASQPLEAPARNLNPASAVEWGGGEFAGILDELAIYGQVVPPERVKAHYEAGR